MLTCLRWLLPLLLVTLLMGCGQKGPLRLPPTEPTSQGQG